MPRNTVYVPFPLSPHKKASEDFIDSIEKLYWLESCKTWKTILYLESMQFSIPENIHKKT